VSASSRAEEILAATGAVITASHVVYTSGRHGTAYVNKDAVYPYPEHVSALCRMLADVAAADRPEVVCGPALGGIILSQWTAHHLGAQAVYAEKLPGGELALRRGYDHVVTERRVLVVEDIVTTGGSVRQTVAAVRAAGGQVTMVAALCNRGGITAADLGVPAFSALVTLSLDSWEAASCPLCRDGVPVNTEVGKGAEFLASRRA
jgi:orotate phosphoribosyltransferase